MNHPLVHRTCGETDRTCRCGEHVFRFGKFFGENHRSGVSSRRWRRVSQMVLEESRQLLSHERLHRHLHGSKRKMNNVSPINKLTRDRRRLEKALRMGFYLVLLKGRRLPFRRRADNWCTIRMRRWLVNRILLRAYKNGWLD